MDCTRQGDAVTNGVGTVVLYRPDVGGLDFRAPAAVDQAKA